MVKKPLGSRIKALFDLVDAVSALYDYMRETDWTSVWYTLTSFWPF